MYGTGNFSGADTGHAPLTAPVICRPHQSLLPSFSHHFNLPAHNFQQPPTTFIDVHNHHERSECQIRSKQSFSAKMNTAKRVSNTTKTVI